MNKATFDELDRGDIVQHVSSDFATEFVVTGNYGGRVTAVATRDLTNPPEWKLIHKVRYKKPWCENCEDPKPGKMVHVTIERTKHRGNVWRCADCGREITSGG